MTSSNQTSHRETVLHDVVFRTTYIILTGGALISTYVWALIIAVDTRLSKPRHAACRASIAGLNVAKILDLVGANDVRMLMDNVPIVVMTTRARAKCSNDPSNNGPTDRPTDQPTRDDVRPAEGQLDKSFVQVPIMLCVAITTTSVVVTTVGLVQKKKIERHPIVSEYAIRSCAIRTELR